jgi:hypothetical protein
MKNLLVKSGQPVKGLHWHPRPKTLVNGSREPYDYFRLGDQTDLKQLARAISKRGKNTKGDNSLFGLWSPIKRNHKANPAVVKATYDTGETDLLAIQFNKPAVDDGASLIRLLKRLGYNHVLVDLPRHNKLLYIVRLNSIIDTSTGTNDGGKIDYRRVCRFIQRFAPHTDHAISYNNLQGLPIYQLSGAEVISVKCVDDQDLCGYSEFILDFVNALRKRFYARKLGLKYLEVIGTPPGVMMDTYFADPNPIDGNPEQE